MKKLILLVATLIAGSASAVEVGDAIHIPLSAVTCVDHSVKRPCFCEPPDTFTMKSAELTVNQEIAGIQTFTGTVGFKTCDELMKALSSGPDILSHVIEKQLTERLHQPTRLALILSLGLGVTIAGHADSN